MLSSCKIYLECNSHIHQMALGLLPVHLNHTYVSTTNRHVGNYLY